MTVGNGIMEIFWSSDTDILSMALRSRYQGWAAVGFRPGSAMEHADIIMAGSDKDETLLKHNKGKGRVDLSL